MSDGTGQRIQHANDPEYYKRECYKQVGIYCGAWLGHIAQLHLLRSADTDGVRQELDIQDLQQQVMARDADFEDLQQQWNLLNFKFCLLVDMVSTISFAITMLCY